MSLPTLALLPQPLLELAALRSAPQDPAQELTQQPAGADGAQPPAQEPGGMTSMLVPMLIIFAIFYFVMILPERKARKKREAMLAEMKKGDAVVTNGGLHGTIAALADDVVTLQVDEGVRLRFSRAAIQSVVAKEG